LALEEQGVPRRREDAGGGLTLVFAILIALLLLKGLGILKLIIGFDPDGFSFSLDVGFMTSAGLFGLLWYRLNQLNDKLSELGERLASIEGQLRGPKPSP